VAIEVRSEDRAVRDIVAGISDFGAAAALDAERALVEGLGGGCQTPVGALATWVQEPTGSMAGELELTACVVALDGSRAVRERDRAPGKDAVALGQRVSARLLDAGAGALLAEAQR
jgi:hydroxymethylbilane synthase